MSDNNSISNGSAHILIFGGSGQTGQLVIDEALRRSHSVTALVRTAKSIPSRTGLTIVEGSPLNKADIKRAMSSIPRQDGNIVVISTLAQTRKSGNPWAAVTSPRRLMADSVENLISVAKENDAGKMSKLVVMSMFGVRESFSNMAFFMRWIMRWSNMDVTIEDHDLVDEAVKASGLNFVLARPAMLMGEEALPVKELGNQGEQAGWMPKVSRRSVAAFLVDAAEGNRWDGQTPVISN